MSCDNKLEIDDIYNHLIAGYNDYFPNINWNDDLYNLTHDPINDIRNRVHKVEIADVTTGIVNGTGAFDQFMKSAAAHLREEYDKNRITGADYTKAWISLMESSMNQAVVFTIQKDDAYWKAIGAQLAAITALINMEVQKAQLAALKTQTDTQKANFALTKAKIYTEELQQCQIKFQTEQLMPSQKLQVDAQTVLTGAQTLQVSYTTSDMLPTQKAQVEAQTSQVIYTTSNMLPTQKANTEAQTEQVVFTTTNILPENKKLIMEQTETQRASTLDTRTDGATVVKGSIGKQKDLYSQQITTYKRKSETDAAQLWLSAWTVHRTTDEELEPPMQLMNPGINEVLDTIKVRNALNPLIPAP